MTGDGPSQREITRLVRSALAHLYDHAFLQNHPLALMLAAEANLDLVARAQNVRRILLDCVEALRPQDGRAATWEAARAHAILTYRYVDGLAIPQIAARLAISRRQAYREHEKGLHAVAELAWEKVRQATEQRLGAGTTAAAPTGRLEAAQAEVARLRQGVHTETLDLHEVLAGALQVLAPVCTETGIRIQVPAAGSWPTVRADRVMLRQALLNLLSHALHSAQGDLSIAGVIEQGKLCLDIREGPPIGGGRSPAPLLKQPALSLEVAQALIAVQAGRLEAGQRDGRWHLWVALPLTDTATILVIDDNADLVALLQRYLRGHAVSVVGASDGQQALRLAAELRPQVISLDVMMPSFDGWEILQQLKSAPLTRDIPVIICSVLNEPEVARAMGASDYITKPVDQDVLLGVLRRWLGVLRPAS